MNDIINDVVIDKLIELFKAVADAVDEDALLPDDVQDAYDDAFDTPEIRALYGALIDMRHEEVFGRSE